MRPCAFFSPRLDPVLDRGKGDKDTVVAPQVPAGRAVGHAVLDDEPYRQIHHAVGVLTARGCQIGEVGATGLATLRTVMLGIGHQQIPRTPQVEIPHIMQCPMSLLVPIGRVTTTWTRLPEVVATVGEDLGLGQVCGCGDPGAGSGRYSPGPNIVLPSWLKGSDPNCTINVFGGQPGALATVSILSGFEANGIVRSGR